jgi:hypothetical protein
MDMDGEQGEVSWMNIIPTQHRHSKRTGLIPDPFYVLAGLQKLKWFFTWIHGRNFSKIHGTKKGSVLKQRWAGTDFFEYEYEYEYSRIET